MDRRTRTSASSCPDTRTAGGQERQKPLVLAQGFFWYLFSAYLQSLERSINRRHVYAKHILRTPFVSLSQAGPCPSSAWHLKLQSI